MAKRQTGGDQALDVLPGELGEDVPRTGLAAEEKADDERALLLEEEDVPGRCSSMYRPRTRSADS